LFTGYTDIQAVEDAINKGAVYRFVNKPWNDEELKSTILHAMEHHDLTQENKHLIEVTKRQYEELQKLDKLKSEFIANVSHELRTPLNAVNIVISNIRAGVAGDVKQLPEKMQVYLDRIESNTKSLKNIVDDLLDIFKLSSADFSMSISVNDLDALITEEIDDIMVQATSKGVAIKRQLASGEKMMMDEVRIRQVMRNLLSNAIKFTEKGGEILVTTERTEKEIIGKVKDSGIGIDPENLEVIFDRFKQVEEKASGKPKGTGLGLAITRKIIELHGGKVWAESVKNEGSTFIFTIPVNVSLQNAATQAEGGTANG
jgi:signal transduction histidine kinase